jgi:hypothetical protein
MIVISAATHRSCLGLRSSGCDENRWTHPRLSAPTMKLWRAFQRDLCLQNDTLSLNAPTAIVTSVQKASLRSLRERTLLSKGSRHQRQPNLSAGWNSKGAFASTNQSMSAYDVNLSSMVCGA